MVTNLRLTLLALVLATSYATTQAVVTLHNNTDKQVGIQWGPSEDKLSLQNQFTAGTQLTLQPPKQFDVIKITYQQQPYILKQEENIWNVSRPENPLLDIQFQDGVVTISRR